MAGLCGAEHSIGLGLGLPCRSDHATASLRTLTLLRGPTKTFGGPFLRNQSKRELFCFVPLCEVHMENPVRTNPPLPSGYPESALNKASSGAHAAVDSIAGAADEAARKAKPAIDQVAAIAHQAVDKAANAAAPAADWLSRQGEDLAAAQKQLVSDTAKYISANPMKSVAIALAAGFVISRIVR